MAHAHFTIEAARSPEDIRVVAGLFEAYAASLDFDLGYQDFAGELAGMPGKYAAPAGELLLARDREGRSLGCVALRPLADGTCEMKRLYVAPQARGLGVGRALVEAVIDRAARIGYREMRLDTHPSMTEAITLYRNLGFRPVEPYYGTPHTDAIFLGLPLDSRP
jgi:ribosomal protein S18 acetylase RimI-like enzyme